MDMEWDGWEAGVVSIRTYALDPNGTSWSWRVVGPTRRHLRRRRARWMVAEPRRGQERRPRGG